MTKKYNIAILGDSWAWGEWNWVGDKNFPTHSGTQHYLHLEYPESKIVNFAIQGGSNLYQIDYISEHMGLENFKKNFDYAVVFWTDPGRDVLNHILKNKDGNFSNMTKSQYQLLCDNSSERSLKQLNNLGVPVLLIGGHVSLPDKKYSNKFENLTFLIDRVCNLIDKPFLDTKKQIELEGKLNNTVDWLQVDRIGLLTSKFLDEIKDDINELLQPLNTIYFPDSGHAGRNLHKMITYAIINEIESNQKE